ncbi:class I tRNA ligase family protein [Bacillus licheniformis]|nr:class I tRNA ligase family protein [Bacillus licheniformis]
MLDQTMRLLHPFMPFLTEEIWQHLPHEGESITVAKWPEAVKEYTDTEAAADMKLLVEVIRAVRNIRSEVNTPLSKQIELYIKRARRKSLNDLKKPFVRRTLYESEPSSDRNGYSSGR